MGRLADGRAWFTMKEVRGRTFGEQIHQAHARAVTEPHEPMVRAAEAVEVQVERVRGEEPLELTA